MILSKKTLLLLLLALLALTNILNIAHINIICTTTLISAGTYIILPGLLISLILRLRRISFWENLLIIVGLSLAFLQGGGLLLNILLPLIGIKDPLAFQNIVMGFNIYILLLFLFAWIRTKSPVVQTKPPVVQIPDQLDLNKGSSPTKQFKPRQFAKPNFTTSSHRALVNLDTQPSTPIPFRGNSNLALENADTISMSTISPSIPNSEKVLYVLPVFFPILAILGAIIINNGGSNILTLILLGIMALYIFILVIFHNKISPNIYTYVIFFIALACLFTTSFRSWYISGHDIMTEFYVFQLTNNHHIWKMEFYQNSYNACLSITILPTVLTQLLAIQDMYVYKVIFQIFFATCPVLIFFLARTYTTPVFSFLSALIFISFPTFINDMPMLNRQEISFIFFGLALYMLLLPRFSLRMRRILFILFGLGVITSHYSTNFILLALVVLVYVLMRIISPPFVKKALALVLSKSPIRPRIIFHHKAFLSLPLVSILFVTTFYWNTVFTNSSSHTGSVIANVVNSILVPSTNDSKSVDVSYSIFSSRKLDPKQQFQEYIQSTIQSARSNKPENITTNQFYSSSTTIKYPVDVLQQEKLAPTPLGDLLTSFHIPVFSIQSALRSISASLIQIFMLIGLFVIVFIRKKALFDIQYLFICFGALLIIAMITILPSLSVEYGLLRMFQQMLFVFSLPIVFGISSILFFLKEQKRIIITGIIAIFFFLSLAGFISHLTGDYYPQMALDNAGLNYDAYYVDKSDVTSIVWLSRNNIRNDPIDAMQVSKLRTYGGINAFNRTIPAVIRKNAYYYLEVSNNKMVAMGKYIIIYNSPKTFLDENKNLIYSNSKNNIYK